MKIGFTGSRHGATVAQLRTVCRLLTELVAEDPIDNEFHQGCCVGSDEQATMIAKDMLIRVVGHPPDKDEFLSTKAVALSDELVGLPGRPYFTRNEDICHASRVLLATPKDDGSKGTWYTVRYMRSLGRKVYVVWPDGSVKEDAK